MNNLNEKEFLKNRTLGEKLSPTLKEIEDTIWDFEFHNAGTQLKFTDVGFRASIKIFMANLLERMYQRQEKENMSQKEREKQAEYFGKEIRELVMLATGVDTHNLYKRKD